MIRMESESESGEEEKSDDVVVIVEQGPATNSKSQSRLVFESPVFCLFGIFLS